MRSNSRQRPRRFTPARKYWAITSMTCAGCHQTIEQDAQYVLDALKSAFHPDCKRFGIRPVAGPEEPRYAVGDPIGKLCQGCDSPIDSDEAVVHVSAQPWHVGCFKLR